MAIVSTKNSSSIKLSLDCGIDEKGKTIVSSKSFNNLKLDALDDDIYEIVESIMSLQDFKLLQVNKIDNATLSK
ncbi:DUF1659 domain-containing protein [Metaclostridioides mangenotii]|uniref:DUF1659 domain-containing protein n=1 Tax=Metaclostridioides mangenotii TaxID=1540 RepID=A0ABS4EBG5_9FIRM|nr:DUF1659 domain-containing protein [Clostridioides mangenotii]MBP1855284.1 hypothetical protein [Clostridioides mangenotii]